MDYHSPGHRCKEAIQITDSWMTGLQAWQYYQSRLRGDVTSMTGSETGRLLPVEGLPLGRQGPAHRQNARLEQRERACLKHGTGSTGARAMWPATIQHSKHHMSQEHPATSNSHVSIYHNSQARKADLRVVDIQTNQFSRIRLRYRSTLLNISAPGKLIRIIRR